MAWKFTCLRYQKTVFALVLSLLAFLFVTAQPTPGDGPGGPVLVISSAANPFTRYTTELLRAEGLNAFSVKDITEVNEQLLSAYDVVVLGEIPLTTAHVSLFTNWTNAGGTFIAFRPDKKLAGLLGLGVTQGTLSDKYILVNNNSSVGAGIVNETIQFHGTADYYKLAGANPIAMLYSTPATPTQYPAITSFTVGTNGGKAIAFTYDLPRSIVYTRQGNPAWAGQKRDNEAGPIRSDDLFFGGNEPDWVDLDKVAIPQADEQQRLLTNSIILGNLHRKPLPRFWFLPRDLKAAVVMTGDDHATNGTEGRANLYKTLGPNSTNDVAEWRAVRSSSYMWLNTPIGLNQALALQADGFELGLHPNTDCQNFTAASLDETISTQLAAFAAQYPGIRKPVTNRTHCLVWSDWASAAKVQAKHGIRLDVNYYYWPAAWVQNRSGMFTGSGMPMRFADLDGTLIDCYQVTTQMTDESGIEFAPFIQQLLDKATGPEGYYGVFCANMHTDSTQHIGATTIIAAAQQRNIPVISASQMLTWLDGRNGSTFTNMIWANNQLSFDITRGTGATGLRAMLPYSSANGKLTELTVAGASLAFDRQVIKGIEYAFFDGTRSGKYVATYTPDVAAPVVTNITATPHEDNTATITFSTDESSQGAVIYGTSPDNLNQASTSDVFTSNHTLTLTGLQPGVTYYFQVRANDAVGNTTVTPDVPLAFTMLESRCFSDIVTADFAAGTTGTNTLISSQYGDGALTLTPAINEEFESPNLPAGFEEAKYSIQGVTTISNGSLSLSGSHVYSTRAYAPGTVLEFTATFGNGTFQNIGFTIDQEFNQETWVALGQGGSFGTLFARSSSGETVSLGSRYVGASHRFRLAWTDAGFDFYVDDEVAPAAHLSFTVSSPMYIQLSDFNYNDGILGVDWLRVGPYASSGLFTSRVFDAGAVRQWGAVNWDSSVPEGTQLQLSARTGNTAQPDATWSDYTLLTESNNRINTNSRYIQYKAELSTSRDMWSPILRSVIFRCADAPLFVISSHPADQVICEGDSARFSSTAEGSANLSVRWQSGIDGTNWTDITGATNPNFAVLADASSNNKKYRAVWSNGTDELNSDAALLSVKTKPVLTSATAISVNSGESVAYIPTSSEGTSFTWVRPQTPGLSNPAVNGSGSINETLVNITSNPVKATYTITLTNNGCTNTAKVEVTVNPATCDINTSISTNFKAGTIGAGRKIWFNAVFKPTNLGNQPVNFYVTNARISYKINGQTITAAVPDAHILFSPSVVLASTTFEDNMWKTRVSINNAGNAFMTGLAYTVPQSIPANAQNVTFSASVSSDRPGVGFTWKWNATVYTLLAAHSGLSIKPADDLLSILSPIITLGNAGTVQNYALFMTAGAMTTGLLSLSSVYTSTQTESCGTAPRNVVEPPAALTVNTTSTNDAALADKTQRPLQATVAPNPGTHQFTLQVKGDDGLPATLIVTDLMGRVIERREKVNINTTIVLGANWGTGTYYAELRQGNERKVLKLVKVR